MALSVAQRKERMPPGAQRDVAREEKVSETYVSLALADEYRPKTREAKRKLRRVRRAIARKMGLGVLEVFEPIPHGGPRDEGMVGSVAEAVGE